MRPDILGQKRNTLSQAKENLAQVKRLEQLQTQVAQITQNIAEHVQAHGEDTAGLDKLYAELKTLREQIRGITGGKQGPKPQLDKTAEENKETPAQESIIQIPRELLETKLTGLTIAELKEIKKQVGAYFLPDITEEQSTELNNMVEEIDLLIVDKKREIAIRAELQKPLTNYSRGKLRGHLGTLINLQKLPGLKNDHPDLYTQITERIVAIRETLSKPEASPSPEVSTTQPTPLTQEIPIVEPAIQKQPIALEQQIAEAGQRLKELSSVARERIMTIGKLAKEIRNLKAEYEDPYTKEDRKEEITKLLADKEAEYQRLQAIQTQDFATEKELSKKHYSLIQQSRQPQEESSPVSETPATEQGLNLDNLQDQTFDQLIAVRHALLQDTGTENRERITEHLSRIDSLLEIKGIEENIRLPMAVYERLKREFSTSNLRFEEWQSFTLTELYKARDILEEYEKLFPGNREVVKHLERVNHYIAEKTKAGPEAVTQPAEMGEKASIPEAPQDEREQTLATLRDTIASATAELEKIHKRLAEIRAEKKRKKKS
ncbi:MAG: hypothetical protein WC783_02470 [Candidatus Paceibacterota bacterium]|jgi:hypothetical protein